MMARKHGLALIIFTACVTGIVSLWFLSSRIDSESARKPPEALALLSGFEPGTDLNYRIYNAQGEHHTGQNKVNADGRFAIPNVHFKTPSESITYVVSVREPEKKDALDVVFTLDRANGDIRVTGQGLPEFARVSLDSPAGRLETRADWAGIFKQDGFENFNQDKNAETIKLAFSNAGVLSDITRKSPKVIEILAAPGGGGAVGDPNINVYIKDFYACTNNGGLPPVKFSWCRQGENGVDRIYETIWGKEQDPETKQTLPPAQQMTGIVPNYVMALMMMGEQLSAVMAQSMLPIGMFLDAKAQLETQREFQRLKAKAHKDYHPSEMMCQIGSFVKTVARTEEKARLEKFAFNQIIMAPLTNLEHGSASDGFAMDSTARLKQFRETYCDPDDNNAALKFMCDHEGNLDQGDSGAKTAKRINKDIDYTRTVNTPLTLALEFGDDKPSDDEEDFIALARNLYSPNVMEPANSEKVNQAFPAYMDKRSFTAMQNVAQNSLSSIAAMKAKSDLGIDSESGWSFMKSMLRELGMQDSEIHEYLGENPSYYAQMEVLTKKAYQNPDFYTNLYDKPANVDRIGVSLEAIKIMQTRDQFDASLRREMLVSLMVEEALRKQASAVEARLSAAAPTFE